MSRIEELLNKGKLKKYTYSIEMCQKEFAVGRKDLEAAISSYEADNFKWATIQAYYAIYHGVRALIFKSGYREESHAALKLSFKELYIEAGVLSHNVYKALERGMNLREMADYKETYSQSGASNLIEMVAKGLVEIEEELNQPTE
ncbi:hypothetical protein MASR2M70_11950 [Bacillota bacterium]